MKKNKYIKKIKSFFDQNVCFGRVDIITLLIIIVLYGLVSFYRLGDLRSIETFDEYKMGEQISFSFSNKENIASIKYFIGNIDDKIDVYELDELQDYKYIYTLEPYGVFTWNQEYFDSNTSNLILIPNGDVVIGEVAFYDSENRLINYYPDSSNMNLNDEYDLIPSNKSYMNSTYFDEVYFARTAYEYTHDLQAYEWVHPPLGKIIQAIPILLTGHFSPFIYRLMGNIAGLVMVGVMYAFGAILFKKRKYAIGACLLVCLDTFFLTISRIGTADTYLVLFITLANMFMILFSKKQKDKYLFLSGLFFALSVSVKWIGLYGGITLAIIYFYTLFKKKIFNYKYILKGFLFFVFIPLFIYALWFYLFPNNLYKTNNIDNIIKDNQEMFEYHSKLTEDHFFSSKWYTWPVSYKPVWLHLQPIDDNHKETISMFGNIVIWYVGIVALGYSIYLYFKNKDITTLFIIISALIMWLPYAFIPRVMFLYHYLSVLPFLYLLIINMIKEIEKKSKKNLILPIYLVCCLIFFIIYYPIATGIPISNYYAKNLQLFDTWYF